MSTELAIIITDRADSDFVEMMKAGRSPKAIMQTIGLRPHGFRLMRERAISAGLLDDTCPDFRSADEAKHRAERWPPMPEDAFEDVRFKQSEDL